MSVGFRLGTATCGALLIGAFIGTVVPAGASAASRCITTLPVSYSLPSPYVESFTSTLPLRVSTAGAPVRRLYIAVYTFSGDVLAAGSLGHPLKGSAVVRLHLRFPMQAGNYTLYMVGYPNANPSCGQKHLSAVLTLRGCETALPVTFPDPPSDSASDYSGRLPIQMSSSGTLLRNLRVTLSSFAGQIYGTTTVDPLFGTATVNIPLSQPLVSGPYTVYVSGLIPDEPASCGVASAKQTIDLT
jgi:hypothetical protein